MGSGYGYYIRTMLSGYPGAVYTAVEKSGEIILCYTIYHMRREQCSEMLFNLPVSDVLVLFIVLYCVDRGLSYDRQGTTTSAVK